jgi:hypothetical protein
VVTELQTNSQLIADFGQLYNQPRSKDEATLKRIANLVTTNRIRVEAHTALTSMRGRLYQQHRPDFVLRDDLENEIIGLLNEAKGGMTGQRLSRWNTAVIAGASARITSGCRASSSLASGSC